MDMDCCDNKHIVFQDNIYMCENCGMEIENYDIETYNDYESIQTLNKTWEYNDKRINNHITLINDKFKKIINSEILTEIKSYINLIFTDKKFILRNGMVESCYTYIILYVLNKNNIISITLNDIIMLYNKKITEINNLINNHFVKNIIL
jgi:hypothetical protein